MRPRTLPRCSLSLGLCGLALSGCAMTVEAGPPVVQALTPEPSNTPRSTPTVLPTHAPTSTTVPTPTRELEPEADTESVRVLFTGDINPGRCPAMLALEADDFTLPYRDVAETLRAADLAVGSLDGALSDVSAPGACAPEREYNLIGPTRTVEGLTFAGFDVINLATNHAQDCGRLGFVCDGRVLADTLRVLRAVGIAPVGAGATLSEARRPVVLERRGVRIALLAVTAVGDFTWAAADAPGTAPLSDAALRDVLADIQTARDSADVVIVLAHWGTEYVDAPSADQRRWAERMIAAGATLIVGNHPHVVQPVEPLGDGLVAYALGNFVFDQDPAATRHGLVLEATFTTAGLSSWRALPIEIVDLQRPEWR